jgi:hypothetical protein
VERERRRAEPSRGNRVVGGRVSEKEDGRTDEMEGEKGVDSRAGGDRNTRSEVFD